MNRLIQPLIRWPTGCLILFLAGCNTQPSYRSFVPTPRDSIAKQAFIKRSFNRIDSIKVFVQDGDLVTRTGNDFTSESLRQLNQRDQTFSHCGIASIEHDSIFIYHAIGGEFNPDQKIRRDPVELFAEPYSNRGIGIFRFRVTDGVRHNFAAEARALYKKEVMFDMKFDLETDDHMYCAEFVYKSLRHASAGVLRFNHSHIRQFEFIGVDDIFLHPLCMKQALLVYK